MVDLLPKARGSALHTPLSRRGFAGLALASLAAACTGPQLAGGAAATAPVTPLGIQLFTIRDLFVQSPRAALEMVARAGFSEVELGGGNYLDVPAAEIRALLDANGLAAPAMHVGLGPLQNRLSEIIAYAKTVGATYIVLPATPGELRTVEGYGQVAQWSNAWAETLRGEGLRFAYHNHAFEFDPLPGDTNGFAILTEQSDPALVGLEMDMHWVARARQDIAAMMRAYSGRIWLTHLKDINAAGDYFALPGEGVMDFAAIFAAADEAGIEHFFFEHDRLASEDYESGLNTAYAYLSRVAG